MTQPEQRAEGHGGFIRLGGAALLVGFAIHIVVNSVIKRMPPAEPSVEELRAYLAAEAGNWAIVHGARYLAIVCIALFAGALFVRTCCLGVVRPVGWGVVGLIGAALMLSNLMITNGVETYLFLGSATIGADADAFWALFDTTRVLFTAEVVAWSVLIGGFSAAGWRSAGLARWLGALGLAQAAFGVLSGVFVVSILTNGRATLLIDIASLSGLAWFLSAGVFLLVRGDRQPDGAG